MVDLRVELKKGLIVKLYPFDMPEDAHPMAWTLLGFGFDGETLNVLARHLWDDLGVRLSEERREVTLSWAVGWPRDPGERTPVEVGDTCDVLVSESGAVRVVAGHLPPGVKLEKHTGRVVGEFTHPGLYSATVEVGPRVKFDPLGTPGGPESLGAWIPCDQSRFEPPPVVVPPTLSDLSPLELDQLIAEAAQARQAKLAREADDGD